MLSEPTVRPRHRIRAYGRVVKASGEAEYKRFLDFLAASTSTEKTVLLSNQTNQKRETVGEIPQPAPVASVSPMVRHSRGYERAGEGVINFAPDARSTRILANDSEQITNQLAGELSTAFAPPANAPQYPSQFGVTTSIQASSTTAGFTTHLAADFASQMAAEFQKTAVDSYPASINSLAAPVEPEQDVFAIESVSLLEEPLTPSMQSTQGANPTAQASANLSAQAADNQLSATSQSARAASHLSEHLSAQVASHPSEPEQFILQAANMLEEWFGKRGSEEDEASDDNELVDGPTDASRNSDSFAIASAVGGLMSTAAPGSAGSAGAGSAATGSAGSGAAGSTQASSPGSLISRLGRISQQELSAIREASFPAQKKAVKRTPPSRSTRGQGRKHWLRPSLIPLDNGNRKEVYASGAAIVKDAVGRVCEVSAANGASLTFTYDPEGHLNGFVRSNVSGKVHSTGGRDKHGVVVRDPDGRVRAQGESMSVDPRGCLSIRRFDGQFWCLDLVRGIHLERRILQDLDGQWNSLTALLTSDGFRMVTRFQKLADTTESYRRYGDWLSSQTSKFRFYGRDGSVIQFDSDEDLQSLRPARIWAPGSRPIDEEWQGIRQAGTAWDSVHQYVSQYLSTL